MKKRFCVLVTILIIVLAIGGCKDTAKPENSDALSSASVHSEAPSSPAPSEYVESTLENFHIALAKDALLSQYDSFHEFVADKGGVRVIIWTDTAVKDFAFISVGYDDTGDEISLLAGDVLFSVDELSPEKPFVAEMTAPEILPIYGISFVDENDVTRYFSINADGRGAEEAPPYFLLEFESGNSQ